MAEDGRGTVDLGHLHRRARRRPRTATTGRWPATPTTASRTTSRLVREPRRRRYRFSIAWPRILPEGRGPRRDARAWTTTTVSSTRCSRPASSRWPRSTTGTCRSPSRTPAAGPSAATAEAFVEYAEVVHAAPRRPGDVVGHAQRALVRGLPRLRRGRARAGTPRGRRGAPGRPPPDARPRLGARGAAGRATSASCSTWRRSGPRRREAASVADGVDAIRNRVWLDPLVDGAYDDRLLAVAPELADPSCRP